MRGMIRGSGSADVTPMSQERRCRNPHKLEHSRGTSLGVHLPGFAGGWSAKRTRTKAEAVKGLAAATGRTASGSIVVPADGRITGW